MAPMKDCWKRFLLTRTVSRFWEESGPSSSVVRRVSTSRRPMFRPAWRPETLRPKRIGTSCPFSSPTVRLKKGIRSGFWLPSPATSKTPAPSKKKVLFSGRNSSKRVRLICRASTSVSAKSVLTVSEAVTPGVMLLKTSSPALNLPLSFSSPPETKGRMSRPRPCCRPVSPVSCPAAARLPIQVSCRGLA